MSTMGLIKPNVQILLVAPQRRDCRFPNKYLRVKGSCSSLPSRTLWIFLTVPVTCTHWDTRCPTSFPRLLFHRNFLVPQLHRSTHDLLEPYLDQSPRLPFDTRKCFHLSRWKRLFFCTSGTSQPAGSCWKELLPSNLAKSWVGFQIDWALRSSSLFPFTDCPWRCSQRINKLTDCELGKMGIHGLSLSSLPSLDSEEYLYLFGVMSNKPVPAGEAFDCGGEVRFISVKC